MDTTIYDPLVIEKLWNKKRNEGDPVDYSTYFLNYQETNLDAQLDVLTGVVKTGAMVGTGIAVTTATAGAGTPAVLSYLAGTGAVAGMSMALDPKVRHSLATGDWVSAMAHGSYHTPFIGNGRNAWEAWQMGKPWSAAGHAGLFSIEALGMRSAGKVRGAVRRGGIAKGAAKAKKAAKVSKQGKVEGARVAAISRTGAEKVKSLNSLSKSEVDKILKESGFELRSETPNWKTYKHADGSKIDISSEGRIVRTQAPKYGEDGRRINKGQRIDSKGQEIPRGVDHNQHPPERLGDL